MLGNLSPPSKPLSWEGKNQNCASRPRWSCGLSCHRAAAVPAPGGAQRAEERSNPRQLPAGSEVLQKCELREITGRDELGRAE